MRQDVALNLRVWETRSPVDCIQPTVNHIPHQVMASFFRVNVQVQPECTDPRVNRSKNAISYFEVNSSCSQVLTY